MADGGSKVTGYIVEFKEVNKEEEEKKAQRKLLLSDAEEEKEPESDEGWDKVEKTIYISAKNAENTAATRHCYQPCVTFSFNGSICLHSIYVLLKNTCQCLLA